MIFSSRRLHLLAVAATLATIATPLYAASDAAPRCAYHKVANLPLHYTGPNLNLTIAGRINGAPAPMLIDTGSTLSMLTAAGAARHGLTPMPSAERMRGAGGSIRMSSARVREFRAGSSAIFNERIRIADDGHVHAHDAQLGAQFLYQTDLELSLATKELRFFKPVDCDDTFLGYWDPEAVVIPFSTSAWTPHVPVFKVTLNGKELTAAIDTSIPITLMTREAAKRIGLEMNAPGMTRVDDAVGIGSHRMARWSTTIESLHIGREQIGNAEVGVVDVEGIAADLLLGTDFLRAHRVLISMRQKNIYLSYVGGPPLGQLRRIEPWLLQEAEDGNGDAQLAVGRMHARGQGAARDPAQARTWIDRAAASGNPRAQLMVGQRLQYEGNYAQAIGQLRAALDRLPEERMGALWLYAARMHSGETDLARRELDTTFARDSIGRWPRPIADFYLGKLDEARLLALAREDDKQARTRTCQAKQFIAEGHRIAGDPARARQVKEQASECRPVQPAPATQAAL